MARHRANKPRPYSPLPSLVAWMIGLALVDGFLVGLTLEAFERGAWFWAVFFGVMTVVDAVLYFLTTKDAVDWITGYRADHLVDRLVYRPVECQDGRCRHHDDQGPRCH